MRVFDRLAGVTLIDIKAGQLLEVMGSLNRTGLLDDVREGRFNLALLHVLGSSAASLNEIATITKTTRHRRAASAGQELRQRRRL
jgi:hypothetical protein